MANRKFTILFVGWMVLITLLSLFSFSDEGEDRIWFAHMDKVVHFTFHLVILVLGMFSLNEIIKKQWNWRKKIILLLMFSVCYGLLIEGLQWLMPFDRSAEFWDVLANLSGALMGSLLIQMNRTLIDRLK